jgi:hypothetical protein
MIPISLSVSIVFGENLAWFLDRGESAAVTPWRIDGYGEVCGEGPGGGFFAKPQAARSPKR